MVPTTSFSRGVVLHVFLEGDLKWGYVGTDPSDVPPVINRRGTTKKPDDACFMKRNFQCGPPRSILSCYILPVPCWRNSIRHNHWIQSIVVQGRQSMLDQNLRPLSIQINGVNSWLEWKKDNARLFSRIPIWWTEANDGNLAEITSKCNFPRRLLCWKNIQRPQSCQATEKQGAAYERKE